MGQGTEKTGQPPKTRETSEIPTTYNGSVTKKIQQVRDREQRKVVRYREQRRQVRGQRTEKTGQ